MRDDYFRRHADAASAGILCCRAAAAVYFHFHSDMRGFAFDADAAAFSPLPVIAAPLRFLRRRGKSVQQMKVPV